MRYLFLLGLIVIVTSSCTDNSLTEYDELRKIDKEDYEVPTNGVIEAQGIEKDEYYIPPNGVYSIDKEDYEVPTNG